MLYAYSPGGPLVDEADYLSRYPGDAFVDVVGFDMYHRNPATEDAWMDGFAETMDVVALWQQCFGSQGKYPSGLVQRGFGQGSSSQDGLFYDLVQF